MEGVFLSLLSFHCVAVFVKEIVFIVREIACSDSGESGTFTFYLFLFGNVFCVVCM